MLMLTYAIEGQHVPIMTLKQSKVKVISLVLPDIFCLILLLINYTLILFDINLNPFIILNTPPNHVYPGYIAFTPFSLLTSYNLIYHFYVSLLGGGGGQRKKRCSILSHTLHTIHIPSTWPHHWHCLCQHCCIIIVSPRAIYITPMFLLDPRSLGSH